MQYTQGQLRNATSISVETFRHWKTVLPYLAKKSGHAASFSEGDILALLILKKLTTDCSIKISNLAEVFDEVMYICNTESWSALEKLALCVDLKSNSCRTAPLVEKFTVSDVMIIISLATSVHELRDKLTLLQIENSHKQSIAASHSHDAASALKGHA